MLLVQLEKKSLLYTIGCDSEIDMDLSWTAEELYMDDGFYDVVKRVRQNEWWELCFLAMFAGTMSWKHLL